MADSKNQPLATIAHFPPVPLRPRWSGWTPDKQIAFVEALSETACVVEAARIVGMSTVSAYALRRRPCAHHFREAWDAALDMGVQRLEQAALGRALDGVSRPIFYQGEQVGEWREYDERLTMFLLRYRRPLRFGAHLDHRPAGAPAELENGGPNDDPEDEAAVRLDWHCDGIAELDPGLFGEQPDVTPPADAPAASPPAQPPRADGA